MLKKAESKIRLTNKLIVKLVNYAERSKQNDNQSYHYSQQQDENYKVSEEYYHYNNIDY